MSGVFSARTTYLSLLLFVKISGLFSAPLSHAAETTLEILTFEERQGQHQPIAHSYEANADGTYSFIGSSNPSMQADFTLVDTRDGSSRPLKASSLNFCQLFSLLQVFGRGAIDESCFLNEVTNSHFDEISQVAVFTLGDWIPLIQWIEQLAKEPPDGQKRELPFVTYGRFPNAEQMPDMEIENLPLILENLARIASNTTDWKVHRISAVMQVVAAQLPVPMNQRRERFRRLRLPLQFYPELDQEFVIEPDSMYFELGKAGQSPPVLARHLMPATVYYILNQAVIYGVPPEKVHLVIHSPSKVHRRYYEHEGFHLYPTNREISNMTHTIHTMTLAEALQIPDYQPQRFSKRLADLMAFSEDKLEAAETRLFDMSVAAKFNEILDFYPSTATRTPEPLFIFDRTLNLKAGVSNESRKLNLSDDNFEKWLGLLGMFKMLAIPTAISRHKIVYPEMIIRDEESNWFDNSFWVANLDPQWVATYPHYVVALFANYYAQKFYGRGNLLDTLKLNFMFANEEDTSALVLLGGTRRTIRYNNTGTQKTSRQFVVQFSGSQVKALANSEIRNNPASKSSIESRHWRIDSQLCTDLFN